VLLLEAWSPRLSGFYLYHSSRRQVTPALQAFIDFLKAEAKRRGLQPSATPRATASPNSRLVRMGGAERARRGAERQARPNMRAALPPRIAALSASDTGKRITCAVSEPMNGSSVPNRTWPTPTAPIANISASWPNAQVS
jgi:hypothetical protein